MSRRRKNTFSKAISHIKSTKFDMIEAAPTNSTSGFMTITPNAPNPDYVPGNYPHPSGTPDFEADGLADGKDTTGLFKEDGTIRTALPPVTDLSPDRSYILGPMAAMYYTWAYPWTMIGYIRQADRKFVNLARIDGKLNEWDGVSGFNSASWGGQLTLEQANWFLNVDKAPGQTNDPATANYRAFYPGPPSNTPDEHGRYYCTITGEPLDGYSPPVGDPEIPPEQGPQDPDSNFAAWYERHKKSLRDKIWDWLKRLGIKKPGGGVMPLDFERRMRDAGYDYDDLFGYYGMKGPKIAGGVLGPNTPLPAPGWRPKPGSDFRPGPMWQKPKPGGGTGTWGTSIKLAHREPEGLVLSESKRNILKNLKKPVVIPETKQKKYKVKPKIRGLHSESKPTISKPVAPKEYKKIGGRNLWGQYEHEQNTKASQERMNSVYELLGDGWMAQEHMLTNSKRLNAEEMEKFWGLHPELYSYFYNGKKYTATRKEEIKGDYLVFLVDENGEKSSILQSELNEKLAEEKEKKELEEYNKLNPKPKRNNRVSYEKDPLFKKVYKRLKNEIDYPDKPAKMGYPDDPPPKMVNGWHPEYGKRYKYDKLDPVSAVMMKRAPTGNPEVDANVVKAAKKPK